METSKEELEAMVFEAATAALTVSTFNAQQSIPFPPRNLYKGEGLQVLWDN